MRITRKSHGRQEGLVLESDLTPGVEYYAWLTADLNAQPDVPAQGVSCNTQRTHWEFLWTVLLRACIANVQILTQLDKLPPAY